MPRHLILPVILLITACTNENSESPESVLSLRDNLMTYGAWEFNDELLFEISEELDSVPEIEQLNSATKDVLDYLEKLTQIVEEVGGGRNVYLYLNNPSKVGAIENLMLEQGLASELKYKLEEYSELLKTLGNANSKIPLNFEFNSVLMMDPRLVGLNYEEFLFQGVTLRECLSILETHKIIVQLNYSVTLNLLQLDLLKTS